MARRWCGGTEFLELWGAEHVWQDAVKEALFLIDRQ
jgi:hypothetical protein